MNRIVIKDGWQLSHNYERILRLVERNNGHCPCKPENMCPCNSYLCEDKCCCKLYVKKEETI